MKNPTPPRPPFGIRLSETELRQTEELFRRFQNILLQNNRQTDARILQNLRSRVSGMNMRNRNPSNQIQRALNGGGNTSGVLHIRTQEEAEVLADAVEWGFGRNTTGHAAKAIQRQF